MVDEQQLYRGSPSMVMNFGSFLLSILLIVGGGALGYMYSQWFWIMSGVGLIYALVMWLVVKYHVYELTTQRIKVTTGILTKRTEEMELYRVKDATLIEPFFYRLFGLGNLRISSADPSNPILLIEAIPRARELREQLRNSIEECRDRKGVRLAEFEDPTPGS